MTCWASSRVGTSTRPRGVLARARPPSRRASMARPKARVLPEPVWPRPSTSRPRSASGRVAAWMGNGAAKPALVNARTRGPGRPRSANEGMPEAGAVQSTSGTAGWWGAGRSDWSRAARGWPPPDRRGRLLAEDRARRAGDEKDKRTSGTWHVARKGSAEMWRLRFQRRAGARTSRPDGVLLGYLEPCRPGHSGSSLAVHGPDPSLAGATVTLSVRSHGSGESPTCRRSPPRTMSSPSSSSCSPS